MNKKNDYQPELFEEFTKDKTRRKTFKRSPNSEKINIVISQDKLIVCFIAIIIFFIIVFSLGVERGKRIKTHNKVSENYISKIDKKGETKVAEEVEGDEEIKPIKQIVSQPLESEFQSYENVKFFTVQVAAFKKIHQAKEELKNIKTTEKDAFILKRGKFNIIYVGRFKNKEEALCKQKELKSKYKDCFIKEMNEDIIYGKN